MATSSGASHARRATIESRAAFVITIVAIGEMLVGVALVALPGDVARLLLDAVLDAPGRLVARMLGVAVLALGITWWKARDRAWILPRYGVGFLVYNLGVGLLFGGAALADARPSIAWLVCIAHVAAGMTIVALMVASAWRVRQPAD